MLKRGGSGWLRSCKSMAKVSRLSKSRVESRAGGTWMCLPSSWPRRKRVRRGRRFASRSAGRWLRMLRRFPPCIREISLHTSTCSWCRMPPPNLLGQIQARVDPSATLAVAGDSSDRLQSIRLLEDLGTDVSIRAWQAADAVEELASARADCCAADVGDLAPRRRRHASCASRSASRDVTDTHRFRMLFDERTFATLSCLLGRRDSRPAAGRGDTVDGRHAGCARSAETDTARPPAITRAMTSPGRWFGGAADRRADGARFQRRRHRSIRGSKRRVGGASRCPSRRSSRATRNSSARRISPFGITRPMRAWSSTSGRRWPIRVTTS